ncbi:MAG: sigma factor-like helix-turn-helix DNA-binding protein [Bacillota bacterium]
MNPLIYFPVHIKEKLFELYDIVFEHNYNCEKCNDNDFCENLLALVIEKSEVDYSTAHRYLEYIYPCNFIDDLFDENDDEVFSDFGLMEHEILERINIIKVKNTILELISHLKPREQEVLLARFGFINDEPKTLEQVGQVMRVTRERVRQIEAKALRQLQHPSRIKILRQLLMAE